MKCKICKDKQHIWYLKQGISDIIVTILNVAEIIFTEVSLEVQQVN